MQSQSEAQACALEPTLGSASSLASRRAVRSLAALQPATKENQLVCYVQRDANLRFGENEAPVLCLAAQEGAAPALNAADGRRGRASGRQTRLHCASLGRS